MKKTNINYFNIDKGEDPLIQANSLKKFINNKLKEDYFSKFLIKISSSLALPIETVEFETKQYLIRNHNFVTGKFKNIFKFSSIFYTILKFYFGFIYIILFSKKINFLKNVDIIYDECETKGEIERVKNLSKHFKTYLIISSVKIKNDNNVFYFGKYKNCDRDFLLKNFKKLFFFNFIYSLRISYVEKTNLLSIYLHILKRLIKYETIFTQIKATFLLQERHYTTSAIKNFLFKKHGGKITSCLQKNIIQIGETGFCINTDVLFSIGRKGTEILKSTDCQINKIVPVGSTFMENWINLKKDKEPLYDMVNFAGNDVPLFSVHKNYMKNYYEHLKWIAKFSYEFPELKIIIKHHSNNKKIDQEELNIIKGTSIKRIVKGELKNNSNHSSYGYGLNAKFICTWCSTIAYEFLSNKKPCYFLDPKLENNSWLHYEEYNSLMRLGTYEDFKKKAMDSIFKNKVTEIKNNEDFCLKSDNVSKNIYDYFRNYI